MIYNAKINNYIEFIVKTDQLKEFQALMVPPQHIHYSHCSQQ